jgi:hypothetical protein
LDKDAIREAFNVMCDADEFVLVIVKRRKARKRVSLVCHAGDSLDVLIRGVETLRRQTSDPVRNAVKQLTKLEGIGATLNKAFNNPPKKAE